MPVNEQDVVDIMGGMPEGIRLNDHKRRLKNRQAIVFLHFISTSWDRFTYLTQ